jgi:Ca2+-binding EF-hand superfamily protein
MMKKQRVTAVILAAIMTVLVTNVARAKSGEDAVKKAQPVNSEGATSLPESQRRIVEHAIKMLDTNQDGKISRSEYMVPYEKRFDREDTNHDGFMTKEEYINAWTKVMKQMDKGEQKMP